MARLASSISLLQRKYVLEILEDIGFFGEKVATFPIEQNLTLGPDDEERVKDLFSCR